MSEDAIDLFDSCDFEYAKYTLIDMFKGSVLKKDLSSLLDDFCKSPSPANAMRLARFDAKFCVVFYKNTQSVKYELWIAKGQAPSKIESDPYFETYCRTIYEESYLNDEFKKRYIKSGYSEIQISQAVGCYYKSLM